MRNNSVPKFIFRLSRFPVYRGSVLGRFYCNSLPAFWYNLSDSWRCNRKVVSKRLYVITTTRCVITHNIAGFICFAAEAWNQAQNLYSVVCKYQLNQSLARKELVSLTGVTWRYSRCIQWNNQRPDHHWCVKQILPHLRRTPKKDIMGNMNTLLDIHYGYQLS